MVERKLLYQASTSSCAEHTVNPRIPSSLVIAAAFALAIASVASAAAAQTRYVFATFGGDDPSQEKLSLYTSQDGLNFTLLSNTNYTGPTGVLRDPSIIKHTDGKYYIAYTLKSWTTTSASFAIASSPDLTTWTFQTEIPAQVDGVKNTWAPEWFKDSDGSIHLIVNIDTLNTDSDFRSYLYTATDATLTKWSAPTLLGIGPNYIDTFVVKVGAQYHAFTKNETSKFIEHATATALTGPWTFVGTGDWAKWGSGKEGPALFQLDSGQWRILMDCYGGCGFLTATSSDLSAWSGTAVVPGGLSGVVRHGTVLREDLAAGGSGGATNGAGGTGPGGGTSSGAASGTGASGARASDAGTSGSYTNGGSTSGGSSGNAAAGEGGTAGPSSAGSAGHGEVSGSAATASGSAGSPTSSGLAGSTNAGGAPSASPGSNAGCSCSVPSPSSKPASAIAGLLAIGALRRRRRRALPVAQKRY
jgi:MYXO-CTERM domain-containing protein